MLSISIAYVFHMSKHLLGHREESEMLSPVTLCHRVDKPFVCVPLKLIIYIYSTVDDALFVHPIYIINSNLYLEINSQHGLCFSLVRVSVNYLITL